MKANELMIGDWVFCTYKQQNYKVAEIKTVADDELKVVVYDENIPLVFQMKYFEPIPLTAEILEKNGWKYNDMPFVQGWEQYGILLYAGGSGYRINCGTNIALIIDSVHELQHALRLCGIDKEIVL